MRRLVVPLRTVVKRLVAGLVVASLVLQAALIVAQLTILIAAKTDVAAALPGAVICTEHGLATAPSDDADKPSVCKSCPLCLTPGAGQLAILFITDFSRLEASAQDIVFHSNADRGTDERSAQPRSRGPPIFA
jgi:DUF2946 family protein